MEKINLNKLKILSYKARLQILKIVYNSSASHIGSCFSIIDSLITLYFYLKLKKKLSSTKVILSKGHAAAALYVVLNKFKFISNTELKTFYKNGSKLMGHASHMVNGVTLSTGSLGHGLSVGCGIAYAYKKIKKKNEVFVFMSDGECNEGSIWEALLFASHNNLNNIKVLLDYNKLQSIYSIKKTLNLEPLKDKWRSFGWDVTECLGHNYNDVLKFCNKKSNKPKVAILHTIKGKGVSFMENNNLWHYRCPNKIEFEKAEKELKKNIPN